MNFSARLCAFFLAAALASGQAKKPLTTDDLIEMKKANFDEQTMIKAIETNGTAIDTSVKGLTVLKNAGLSDRVINAALSAGSQTPAAAGPPDGKVSIAEDLGAFVIRDGATVPLPLEGFNYKSSGVLTSAATSLIVKSKMNGVLTGTKSSIQIPTPIELTLRCREGSDPSQYQLLILNSRKDHREFTAGKFGLTGGSFGVEKSAIPVKFEKTGTNTYRTSLTNLKRGEYGLYAPDARRGGGGPGFGPMGRMYTFGVTE